MGAVDPLASDADREGTALRLRDAAADGRLTLEELTERLDRTYAARTHGELEEVTRDLAAPTPPGRTPAVRRSVTAILSGAEVRGRLRIEGELHVKAVMGGVQLDLTQAELVGGSATIDVKVLMGGLEIFVPPGVHVETHELTSIMAGHSARVPEAPAYAPVIRIRGTNVMGGIDVRVKQGAQRRELPPGA